MIQETQNFDLKFLFASAFTSAVPSDSCPAAERLLDAASGDTTPTQRKDVVDHLAACPVCAELWRLATLAVTP